MSKNKTLSAAKSAKNDEFYTQYADIQKEINAYLDYDPDVFRGKTVLLPCDDPEWSNFTRFFAQNFETLGLKKLISTSYAPDAKKEKYGVLFEYAAERNGGRPKNERGRIFVLDHDTNKSGRIDLDDLEWQYLEGDGDFRSDEVCRLRDEADVIVTNPPFSLFREFLAWILEGKDNKRICSALTGLTGGRASSPAAARGDTRPPQSAKAVRPEQIRVIKPKQFLIIGNMNAIKYKEVFPLIMQNRLWLGNGFNAGNAYFGLPQKVDPADYAKGVFDAETGLVKFRNCCWFTNIEHGRRHQPLQLMTERENIKYSRHKEVRGVGYRRYINFDGIEVPYVDAIPSDFDGVMGVPISFLDKFCPEQFEIVGMSLDLAEARDEIRDWYLARPEEKQKRTGNDTFYCRDDDGNPVRLYDRLAIRARRRG